MANLRAAIEHAGTALVPYKTGLPVGDFLNMGRALFGPDGPASLKLLAQSVERSMAEEIEREHGGKAAAGPVIATLADLLEHHARDLRTVIEQHGMQEASVAAAILEDGEPLLLGLDAGARSLLLKLLKGTYRHYLAQRERLHDLTLIALPTLFERQAQSQVDVERIRAELELLKAVEPPSIPFSIRAPVPDFKGYEAERATIRAALAGGKTVGISAVHGMGGAGKSELARKVAEEMAVDFPDGQILVEMKGTTTRPLTAADAMTEVLVALGAKAAEVMPARRNTSYHSRIRGKRLLIILDNVASGAGLDELRPQPPTALLVTSRNRLQIPKVETVELERISRDAAKALLAAIVPTLDDAISDEIAELCCDLPLALRVAGAYLQETQASAMSYVKDLKKRRRLDHLADSAGDIERPELDPRYVLGLSYDRLAEAHRAVARSFALLSVFPADFDEAGAAAVLNLGPAKARRHLGQMVRRSLVQRHSDERYRLHDLLRDLAVQHSRQSEHQEACNRYAKFYHRLLGSRVRSFFPQPDLDAFIATFDQELPNYRYSLTFIDPASLTFLSHLQTLAITASYSFNFDLAEQCYLMAIQEISAAQSQDLQLKSAAATILSDYAVFLRAKNRSSEALRVINQAIMHYGQIPGSSPDQIFALARCHGIYADCLESAGYPSKAREVHAESIRLIWNAYMHNPAEMSHWLSLWSGSYRERCTRHGVEPEASLLERIEAELARLGGAGGT